MLIKGCLGLEEETFLWILFQKGKILLLSFQLWSLAELLLSIYLDKN